MESLKFRRRWSLPGDGMKEVGEQGQHRQARSHQFLFFFLSIENFTSKGSED
jgi:hypothetical protein